ncbi:hypothetical protein [Polaromonas sp. A23]|nr:hypothetical protein [Polaromonas sp. A23]
MKTSLHKTFRKAGLGRHAAVLKEGLHVAIVVKNCIILSAGILAQGF